MGLEKLIYFKIKNWKKRKLKLKTITVIEEKRAEGAKNSKTVTVSQI